jgi:molybdate transport system regulatory protein
LRIWIERRGKAVLGEGRADLLAGIQRTRSISAAAREIGMSYRHAWLMVQSVNEAAGETLVASAVGGKRGGGAELTEKGIVALTLFRELSGELRRSAAATVGKIAAKGAAAATASAGAKSADHADASSPEACLRLAAAVSLQEVVGEILTEYALVHAGASIRTLFAASNELADQIVRGTNIDVFLTGDSAHIALLRNAKALQTPPKALATNGLSVVASSTAFAAETPLRAVRKPSDLRRAPFARIALADKACPLGQVTAEFLTKHMLGTALAERTVVVDNSRAVLAAVRGGRADLGLVFSSDAVQAVDCRTLFRVPASQASATYYALALGTPNPEAEALMEFLAGPAARRCFRRCGLGSV